MIVVSLASAEEELERDDVISLNLGVDVRSTDRLKHTYLFIGVEEHLVANDVPVVVESFYDSLVHKEIHLLYEGTANL